MNIEGPSRFIVSEIESDTETIDGDQGSLSGLAESRLMDEESRRNLREQLRQTLNKKESHGGEYLVLMVSKKQTLRLDTDFATITRRKRSKGKEREMVETPSSIGDNIGLCLDRLMLLMLSCPRFAAADYPPRQYFVLTDAGKPVFVR